MKNILILLLLFAAITTHAQGLFHVGYDWDSIPTEFPADSFRSSKAVIVKDHRFIEYYQEKDNSISRFKTYHTILWLNDHSAVDRFNKLYIPIREGNKLLYVKARTVNPDGRFTEYTNGALQHLENVEGLGNFDVFAIDGVQLGGMVEYIYTIRESNNYFGREVFQTDIPVLDARFQLIYPDYLRFIARSYNGFGENKIETAKGKSILHAEKPFIPAAFEEDYSAHRNSLQRVEYKLSVNTSLGEFELFDFERAAQQYWEYLHDDNLKGQRLVKELIGEWKIAGISDIEERIRAINMNIIQKFTLIDGSADELQQLEKVAANRYGNGLGIQRLYVALLEAAGIEFQIAFTSNRFEYAFDKGFESWLQLDGCLLYFPISKKYIEPNNLLSLYGAPSYELAGNDALFIFKKGEQIQNEIRPILLPPADYNESRMEMDVSLINGWQKCVVNMKLSNSGYEGETNRFIYHYTEAVKRDEFIRSLILATGSDVQIDSYTVANTALEDCYENKAFEVKAKTFQAGLLEFAGNNLLFNVGELIGQQKELYVKQDRRTDIEFRYPLQYIRHIRFQIPRGYRIVNPDILNMNIEMPDQSCFFRSTYQLNADTNELVLDVKEVYPQSHYPKYLFEDFKRVINAAADFNKLVLILERIE